MEESPSERIQVFISYARADGTDVVDQLERDLLAAQYTPWIDRRGLEGGHNWMRSIQHAIDRSQALVVVLTPAAVESGYVHLEYHYAQEEGKQVIPVIWQAVKIPFDLRLTHCIDFQTSYEDGLRQLLDSLNRLKRPELGPTIPDSTSGTPISKLPQSTLLSKEDQDRAQEPQPLTFSAPNVEDHRGQQSTRAPRMKREQHGRYGKSWTSRQPGCIIVLLDQSGAMEKPFGAGQRSKGQRTCDMVATVLNGFLQELILINTRSSKAGGADGVQPRADIAVVGYGGKGITSALSGDMSERLFVSLPELEACPAEIAHEKLKEIDAVTGREVSSTIEVPRWVHPKANGRRPLYGALRRAKELAEYWVYGHPENYPPVVMNITGGAADDGDLAQIADELRQLNTRDGQTLLFNVYITGTRAISVYYPTRETELPEDDFVRLLFALSSDVPSSSRALLAKAGTVLEPGARGVIVNGDATSIMQMFRFE